MNRKKMRKAIWVAP